MKFEIRNCRVAWCWISSWCTVKMIKGFSQLHIYIRLCHHSQYLRWISKINNRSFCFIIEAKSRRLCMLCKYAQGQWLIIESEVKWFMITKRPLLIYAPKDYPSCQNLWCIIVKVAQGKMTTQSLTHCHHPSCQGAPFFLRCADIGYIVSVLHSRIYILLWFYADYVIFSPSLWAITPSNSPLTTVYPFKDAVSIMSNVKLLADTKVTSWGHLKGSCFMRYWLPSAYNLSSGNVMSISPT